MMPTSNAPQTIQLRLTTLSPLAIGKGDKLSPYSDFVEHDNRLHLIDTNRVEAALADRPDLLDAYVAGITAGIDNNRSHFELEKFLTNRLRLDLPAVSRRIYPLGHGAAGGVKQELYTILKTPNGQPYVPGSSLKGAIKTALL
jgi:CRISPR-associated protein Csm5